MSLLQLCLEGRDAADGGELHRDVLHLRKDLVRLAVTLFAGFDVTQRKDSF